MMKHDVFIFTYNGLQWAPQQNHGSIIRKLLWQVFEKNCKLSFDDGSVFVYMDI